MTDESKKEIYDRVTGEVPVVKNRNSGEVPVVIPIDESGSVIVHPPKDSDIVSLPRLALVVIMMALVSCFLATIVSAIGWYSAAQGQNEAEAQVDKFNEESRCRSAAAVDVSQKATELHTIVGSGIQTIEQFIIAISTRTPDPTIVDRLRINEPALEAAIENLQAAQKAQQEAQQACQGPPDATQGA